MRRILLSNLLLEIQDLKKYFPVTGGLLKKKIADVKAIDGVTFNVEKGTTVALVGESGSGKTQLAMTIAGLNRKNYQMTEGCIKYNFDGINELLEEINNADLKWGIVTNKPKVFAKRIVSHFFIPYKPHCLICPEHTGERKPSPKGLLKACEVTKSLPSSSVYIGDHSIDIEAGKRAKIITIAAAYGYIPLGQSCSEWQADFIAESPHQIKSFIPSIS